MGGSCRVRLRLGRVLSSPAGGIIQSICYQLEPINTLKVYNKKYKKDSTNRKVLIWLSHQG